MLLQLQPLPQTDMLLLLRHSRQLILLQHLFLLRLERTVFLLSSHLQTTRMLLLLMPRLLTKGLVRLSRALLLRLLDLDLHPVQHQPRQPPHLKPLLLPRPDILQVIDLISRPALSLW
jgi:hypothetical protein